MNDPSNIPTSTPYFSGALPDSFADHLDDDTDRTQQLSSPEALDGHPPAPPPPTPPPRPAHPGYLLGRAALDEPLWRRLQPIQVGAELTCGRDADRNLTLLSDHAPIAGNLMLFPMRQPAKYHPAWDHALEVRVTSTDVTGTADCIGGICGETEVYFDVGGARTSISGAGEVWPWPTPFTTNPCHGWTLPNEDPNCMVTWGVWRLVMAGDALTDEVTFKMREADLGRDDHYSITYPPSDPRFVFDWTESAFQLKNQDRANLSAWPVRVTIRNTDPILIGLHRVPPDLPEPPEPLAHLFNHQTPFASFVIELHEDNVARPPAVSP